MCQVELTSNFLAKFLPFASIVEGSVEESIAGRVAGSDEESIAGSVAGSDEDYGVPARKIKLSEASSAVNGPAALASTETVPEEVVKIRRSTRKRTIRTRKYWGASDALLVKFDVVYEQA